VLFWVVQAQLVLIEMNPAAVIFKNHQACMVNTKINHMVGVIIE